MPFRNIYAISVTIIGWYCDPQKSYKLLEMEASSSTPPIDRHKIVYIIFVWLGVGTLLPWNFFITQTSYWNYRYRDLTCQVSYGRKLASRKYILNITLSKSKWLSPCDFCLFRIQVQITVNQATRCKKCGTQKWLLRPWFRTSLCWY